MKVRLVQFIHNYMCFCIARSSPILKTLLLICYLGNWNHLLETNSVCEWIINELSSYILLFKLEDSLYRTHYFYLIEAMKWHYYYFVLILFFFSFLSESSEIPRIPVYMYKLYWPDLSRLMIYRIMVNSYRSHMVIHYRHKLNTHIGKSSISPRIDCYTLYTVDGQQGYVVKKSMTIM